MQYNLKKNWRILGVVSTKVLILLLQWINALAFIANLWVIQVFKNNSELCKGNFHKICFNYT